MVTQSTLNKAVYFTPIGKKALSEMKEAVELQTSNIDVGLPKNAKLILKENVLGRDEAVIESRSGNKTKEFKRRPRTIGIAPKDRPMMLAKELSIPFSDKKVVVIPMQAWYGLIHHALESDLASLAESTSASFASVKGRLSRYREAISDNTDKLKHSLAPQIKNSHQERRHIATNPKQTPRGVETQGQRIWQSVHNPSFM